jgi:endonuclease/exonuclease/phosphatase family metal-dependent hydrolase
MPRIAERLNGYDVVLIQEDFRYHDRLVGGVEHTLIERGNASRFWLGRVTGLFMGSGLTLLARSAPEDQLALTRESFDSCSGWIAGANDCLATKGFMQARLRLANGREVDFYTVHLEAGSRSSDRRTRAEQLDRLASRMRELSGDRPVVVGGDFNLRWDVAEDRAQLEQFLAQTELVDSGAVHAEPELWTRIDYLFYRSGRQGALEVLAAGQDREFVYEAGPLSDHPALFLRLRVR